MTTRRTLLSIASLLLVASAGALAVGAPAGKWNVGQHYTPTENPQPPTVAAGKVEVAEFFWYGCSHCFALDPVLEDWNTKKAPFIEFVRVPVIWGPVHRQHAKLYYTILALRRPELHAKAFDAIHRDGNPLAVEDDVKAREMQLAFFKANGVDEGKFNATYDSMMVTMNVQKAERLTLAMMISSVPTLVINGKYKTGVNEAGGDAQLIALLNDLAASEKPR